jgi:hypothetical protein
MNGYALILNAILLIYHQGANYILEGNLWITAPECLPRSEDTCKYPEKPNELMRWMMIQRSRRTTLVLL